MDNTNKMVLPFLKIPFCFGVNVDFILSGLIFIKKADLDRLVFYTIDLSRK
jgi:hypothetical protein